MEMFASYPPPLFAVKIQFYKQNFFESEANNINFIKLSSALQGVIEKNVQLPSSLPHRDVPRIYLFFHPNCHLNVLFHSQAKKTCGSSPWIIIIR